jgi:hypothetical protein
VIGVSARSYVAAGLATAVAGAVVASPMLAQRTIPMPSVSSAGVELSALAESATTDTVTGAKAVGQAVRHLAETISSGAAAMSANVAVGGPLVRQAAVTAVANVVHDAVARPKLQPNAATVHQNAAVSPTATAAVNPGSILAVPLLVGTIVADIPAAVLEVGTDGLFGIADVLEGMALGDQDEIQEGIDSFQVDIPDDIANLQQNISRNLNEIAQALGLGTVGGTMATKALANQAEGTTGDVATKSNDPKSGTVSKSSPDTKSGADTKSATDGKSTDDAKATGAKSGTDTKSGTQSASSSSRSDGHKNAPSGNETVKNTGTTKTENATHAGAPSGSTGSANKSGPSAASPKHSAPSAKKAGNGGSKGSNKGGGGK